MEVNDIIFHSTFGFGVIDKIDEASALVCFNDRTKRRIVTEFITNNEKVHIFSKDEIHYLLHDFPANFGGPIIIRGKDYFQRKKVDQALFDKDHFEFIVHGTMSYKVSIKNLDYLLIKANCSCPVGYTCKHAAAALFYLQNGIQIARNNLERYKAKSTVPSQPVENHGMQEIINATEVEEIRNSFTEVKDLYSSDPLKKLESLKKSYQALENASSNELQNYLTKVVPYTGYHEKYLVAAMIASSNNIYCHFLELDDKRNRLIAQIKKSVNNYYKFFQIDPDNLRANSSDSFLICAYVQGDLSKLENVLINQGEISKMTEAILEYLHKNKPMTEPLKTWILEHCDEIDMSVPFENDFFLLLNDDEIEKFIQDRGLPNNVSFIFNQLTPKGQLLTLEYFDNYREAYQLFIDNVKNYMAYPQECVEVIYDLYRAVNAASKKCLLEILREIPGSEFVQLLVSDNYKSVVSRVELNYSNIDRYFTTRCFFNEDKYSFHYAYEIDFSMRQIFYIKHYNNQIECKQCLISGDREMVSIIHAIDDYLTRKYASYIDSKKAEALARIQALKEAEMQESIARRLDEFTNSMNRLEVSSLDLKHAIQLEVSLSLKNEYSYSLKVGEAKLYVVKKIDEFLNAVYNNLVINYGTKTSFYHSIENFEEGYRPFLQYLLNSGAKDHLGYTRRDGKLYKENVYPFIESLKGNSILVEDKSAFIRLEPQTPKISMDANYCLHSSLDDEYDLLFTDGFHTLLLKKDTGIVDLLEGSKKLQAMYLLVKQFKGYSIAKQASRFKTEILPRIEENIEIAPEIRDKFSVPKLRIDSYFDFEDYAITVRCELYQQEMPIVEQNLSSYEALQKSRLDRFFETLGFKENKITSEDEIYRFLKMDFTELKKLTNVYLSDNLANKQMMDMTPQTVRIQYQSNMMEAFLEKTDYSDEELDEILKALKRKKKYLLLQDNRIIDLEAEESQKYLDLATDMNLNPKKPLSKVELPIYQCIKAYAHDKNVKMDEYLSGMLEELAHFKEKKREPKGIQATLRNYQLEAYQWLSILKEYHLGGILADDMGLGKTLEMICLLQNDEALRPSLIVCPKSLIFNWKNEIERFAKGLKAVEIYGMAPARKTQIEAISYEEKVIYITSYDSIIKDCEYYTNSFEYIILDEAQAIKNVSTQKAKQVKTLKAAYKFALTGTPIENNVLDLWSIFDFIMPGYLTEFSKFKSEAEAGSESFHHKTAMKVAPFILRRTKKDVLKDLPPKYERIVTAEMTTGQRKLYDAHCKKARDVFDEGGKSFDVLYLLTRLRQICVDPQLFVEDYRGDSGKMNLLHELIQEYQSNHKMIIFSQFVSALKIIETYLKESNISYFMLTGDTEGKERLKLSNEFNNNDTVRVFLVSLKAGGTGLNLTGADTIIHLDPWWNSSVENQATDRAYRIGQTKNVEVIKLICENTIEQRVIELQNQKKDIIDKLIASDDQSITSITKDDLKFILTSDFK